MRQLMHSFEGLAAPDTVRDAVRRGEIAAFCLFRHWNVQSPAQVRELTTSLRSAAEQGGHLPPIIGIDQEGGQLIAICEGATELPGNMALGATRSPELAEQAGEVLGRELLAMGINLDFVPSVDVSVNPANVALGTRSFGDDPQLVAQLGAALIRGLQRTGALATTKHFPGLGDTAVDSHYAVPVVAHDIQRLREVEMSPFQAAIRAGTAAIMVGHVLAMALDDQNVASVSPAVLKLLRQEFGFGELVMTDAMDMQAVTHLGYQQSIEAALQAGVDLALLAHLPDQLVLADALRWRENPEAVRRIQSVQSKIPVTLPPLDVIGCAEHRRVAQEIADRSITLVCDMGSLPLRPKPETAIAVITPYPENLTPADTSADGQILLAEAIRQRHRNVQWLQFRRGASEPQIAEVFQAALAADIVVVGTINADRDPAQATLVNALQSNGKAPIVVALRTPYDLTVFPSVETYVCAYGIRPATVEAVARVLFGEIAPVGTLPCRVLAR
jgi:beta-N-acetylhexosaminidase